MGKSVKIDLTKLVAKNKKLTKMRRALRLIANGEHLEGCSETKNIRDYCECTTRIAKDAL